MKSLRKTRKVQTTFRLTLSAHVDYLDELESLTQPPSLLDAAAAVKKAIEAVTGSHGKISPQDSQKALANLADVAENFMARARYIHFLTTLSLSACFFLCWNVTYLNRQQAGANMDRNTAAGLLQDIAGIANTLANFDDNVRRNAPLANVKGSGDNAKQQIDNLLRKVNELPKKIIKYSECNP